MLVMYTYNGFALLQFLLDHFNYGSTWLLRNLPFVVKSLGMQIMIGVLLLFVNMNLKSYNVLVKPSFADNIRTNKERYFDPQTDLFVRCFTVNSYICAFLFYILCNILASGMRNMAVRNALVLLCISVSTIQIILCSHILYQYYNIDTNNITFDTTRTWIVQYNFMFSIFVLMIGVYSLTNSIKGNSNNYFDSCFELTIVHLCFIFLLYFEYKFRGSPFFNRDVIFIKIILYISYLLPFVCLCLGECYVFFENPFPIELKITSAVVFLIVFYYVILLIQLNSGISYNSMSFEYKTLELYSTDISNEILLSVVVLVIALHIIVFR